MRLGRIGFDRVVGFLEGGLVTASARTDLIATTDRLSPDVAAERLATPSAPVVVDVRAPSERKHLQIPGSLHVPLNHLRDQLADLPRDRSLLVFCAGGYRSSIAASLLQNAGFSSVTELAGGFAAWDAGGLPVG